MRIEMANETAASITQDAEAWMANVSYIPGFQNVHNPKNEVQIKLIIQRSNPVPEHRQSAPLHRTWRHRQMIRFLETYNKIIRYEPGPVLYISLELIVPGKLIQSGRKKGKI